MKRQWALLFMALFLAGCSQFSFEPHGKAPETEHAKAVHAQQNALKQQQETILDNYRL